MSKFKGILIVTDIDGTLLKDDKTLSRENLDAIEYFKAEGGRFTIITGRPSVIVRDIYDMVKPNAPLGCFNGGAIYDVENNKFLWKIELDPRAMEMVAYVDEVFPEMSIQICCFENCYFSKMNTSLHNHLVNEKFPDLRKHYSLVDEPLAKVLFAHLEEEKLFRLRDILNSHPLANDFDFVRSHPEYYEILPKGVSKGALVLKLVDLLRMDIKKTIAVGDNDNDASMIKCAGLGVCVSNGSAAAKEAADLVTVSNEEHAIAKIINDLDSGKIIL